jgi:hypothetical protein
MRDRIYNRTGPKGDSRYLNWIRFGQVVRTYNYQRLLGGQTVSSVPDLGKLVQRYGMEKTSKAAAAFVSDMQLNKLTREQAKQFLTALDWVLDSHSTSRTGAEIGDIVTGGHGVLRKAQEFGDMSAKMFARVTGMATWNASLKALAALMEVNSTIRAATKGLDGLTEFQKAGYRQMGFTDEDLAVIKQQFEKHGEWYEDALARPRTELWDAGTEGVAQKLELAAMRAGDIVTTTRGSGDLPLMMDSPIVKSLFQFKSFGMASVNRTLIPFAQGLAHGDIATANGVALMIGLGTAVYAAKELVAGRQPSTDPMKVAQEAMYWSGLMAYTPDLADPILSIMPEPLRSVRGTKQSGRTPAESAFGPSYGTLVDVIAAIANLTGPTGPDDPYPSVTQKDIHMARKLMLWQNLVWWRRVIDVMEGEVGEAIGAEGATTRSAVDRFTELEPAEIQ